MTSPDPVYPDPRIAALTDNTGKRYRPRIESVSGFGRFKKYRLTIHLEGTSLVYGPEITHCWYMNNPDRARRKGARICTRLNRDLEQHEARAQALKEN